MEEAAVPPGRFRRWMEAARQRRGVACAAACAFLIGAAWVVQIASEPSGPRFWPGLSLFAGRLWPLAGSVAVLLAGWVVLWAATHRARLAAALLVLLWLPLALVNAAKLANLDLPLLPLDVYRAGDVLAVFHGEFLRLGGWGKCLLLATVAGPLALAIAFLPAAKGRPRTRVAAGVAAFAFLASLFSPAANVFAHFPQSFTKYPWDSRGTYDRNGFVVFLAMHCRTISAEAPPGYSEEAVQRIVGGLPAATGTTSTLHPNVIVILSESFTDPTRLPGVEFDADPVPTLHRLQQEFGRLDLVSPVFGGLTCNAELEVLTGFNMSFFPERTAAWVDSARGSVPSLASILRGHGYRALALHAVGGLHSDMQVQPLLGFERCIPGSEWPGVRRLDWRVTDASVTDEIIRQSRELPRPWFLCVNTIEGHTPYDPAKYAGADCGIRFTGNLSAETRGLLSSYACGLRNADRALATLIDSFRDAKDPTLILFYGDHLPDLGDNLLGWRETGLCPPGENSATLRMRTVPAVIWNNYGKRLPGFAEPIGMSRLLPLILDTLEIPKPPHVRLVERIAARWPVVSTAGCFDSGGRKLSPADEAGDPDLADYRLMQYDLLFGRQYFLRPGK